jgi:hypothetical protein
MRRTSSPFVLVSVDNAPTRRTSHPYHPSRPASRQTALSGSRATGAINATVPDRHLDCCNLLAIRGHDYGGSTYLNVRVTYVKPADRAQSKAVDRAPA